MNRGRRDAREAAGGEQVGLTVGGLAMGRAGKELLRGARGGEDGARWRRRHWAAFGWACGATVGFVALLALVLLGDTRAFDLAATGAVQRLPTAGLLGLMVGVSWPGYQPQGTIIALAVVAGLFLLGQRRGALFAAVAILLTRIDGPLKAFAHRARPSATLDGILVRGSVGGGSFPSGHVLTYTVIGGFLVYMAYTHIERPHVRHLVTGALLLLIALVGPSRIYLGAHWLTDVLGSYLLGSALLVGLLLVYRATSPGGVGRTAPAAGGTPIGGGGD